MGSPSLLAETETPPSFGQGDCADSAIGTVLRLRGCGDPAPLLFRSLAFYPERGAGPAGQRLFGYRRDDLLRAELAAALDVAFVEHSFAEPETALVAATALVVRGRLPILQVDHFCYPASHLHRVGHLPHKIVLTCVDGRGVSYRDPFPAFAREGTAGAEELIGWMGRELRPSVFELHSPERLEFDAGRYFRSRGLACVKANVAAMNETGLAALEALASHLGDWVDSGGPAAGPVPLFGLYDVGASRRGHARWLRELAAVSDAAAEALAEAAKSLEDASSRWDVFNSVRAMHDGIDTMQAPSRRFILQKIGTFPAMVRSIARIEAAAMAALHRAASAT